MSHICYRKDLINLDVILKKKTNLLWSQLEVTVIRHLRHIIFAARQQMHQPILLRCKLSNTRAFKLYLLSLQAD